MALKYDRMRLVMIVALFSASACGNDSGNSLSDKKARPDLSAATLGEQVILDTTTWLEQEPYRNADRDRGKGQALMCRACHSFEANGPNKIGPALHGVFGRKSGSVASFNYSPALLGAEFTWTPRALDAWLAQPATFLPGNRMAFAGVPRQEDRDNLIAYLLEATSGDTTNKN